MGGLLRKHLACREGALGQGQSSGRRKEEEEEACNLRLSLPELHFVFCSRHSESKGSGGEDGYLREIFNFLRTCTKFEKKSSLFSAFFTYPAIVANFSKLD